MENDCLFSFLDLTENKDEGDGLDKGDYDLGCDEVSYEGTEKARDCLSHGKESSMFDPISPQFRFYFKPLVST